MIAPVADPDEPDPTPDEIRARCEAYQAKWSPAQWKRATTGATNLRWLVPDGRVVEQRAETEE
jgi:hypothetical protein